MRDTVVEVALALLALAFFSYLVWSILEALGQA
jgi:hypothetical protein